MNKWILAAVLVTVASGAQAQAQAHHARRHHHAAAVAYPDSVTLDGKERTTGAELREEREPLLRQQIIVDGHSPGEWRGDTVRNLDAWYPAFQVQPGQKLYLDPQARVRMW